MISYKRYTRQDIEEMLVHITEHVESSSMRHAFVVPNKLSNFLSIRPYDTDFFCNLAFKDGKMIAGMAASIVEFSYNYSTYGQDHFLFVVPSQRGRLQLVTSLVNQYEDWAKERGAIATNLTHFSGYKLEKYNILAKRLGYDLAGTTYQKEL